MAGQIFHGRTESCLADEGNHKKSWRGSLKEGLSRKDTPIAWVRGGGGKLC